MLKAAYDNGELRFGVSQGKRPLWQTHGFEFGKSASSIGGTTQGSTTAQSGDVTIWTVANTTVGTLQATNETLRAFNLSSIPTSTAAWLQMSRHIRTGNWMLAPLAIEMEFGLASATVAGVTAGATTFNSGTLNIYTLSGGTPQSSSQTLTFYNQSTIQVTTEHWVRVRMHSRSGSWVFDNPYDHQRKPYIRFKVTTAVTTGTASFSAALMEQYGPGLAHPSTTISVSNLITGAGGYVFKGSTGNMGMALWDSSTNYRWVQGECT